MTTTANELQLITLYCTNGLYTVQGRTPSGDRVVRHDLTEAEAEQLQLDREFGPRQFSIGGWKMEENYSPELGLTLTFNPWGNPTIVDPNGIVWGSYERTGADTARAANWPLECIESAQKRYPGIAIDPDVQREADRIHAEDLARKLKHGAAIEALRDRARETGERVCLADRIYDTQASYGRSYVIFDPTSGTEYNVQKGKSKASMTDRAGFSGDDLDWEAILRAGKEAI